MPAITHDGQSLSIDGRRLWIVSGTLHWSRIAPESWAARIAAAASAGLNCIQVPIVWGLHEPRPGGYKFDGPLDLARFIRLVHAADLHCLVRAGPFIGDGYDLGGLPSWLAPAPALTPLNPGPTATASILRSNATAYLAACSKWITALCDVLRDLQATSARKARGPIIGLFSEYRWTCDDQTISNAYLGELDRFFRENGINVPIFAAHNLYSAVESQIDTWQGDSPRLHEDMRQLRSVRPDQPRLASSLSLSSPRLWGRKPAEPLSPRMATRRLAEVLASGAQYNVNPFAAGTCFGGLAGRLGSDPDAFLATAADPAAPLGEAGERGELFHAVRRVSTFASTFGRVFAALEPSYQPATLSVSEPATLVSSKRADAKTPASDGSCSIIECRGTQGSVVFAFAPEHDPRPRRVTLVLGDGSKLPVTIGEQGVAWVLLKAFLLGRATIDVCNLCALGVSNDAFVCYGPAGAPGLISINGAIIEVIVPDGPNPIIERHEDVTVIVCNEESIDRAHLSPKGVYLGVAGLDEQGEPIFLAASKKASLVQPGGEVVSISHKPKPKPALPTFSAWSAAPLDAYTTGASDRFASIDAPAPMQALGAPTGYGWMRLKFRSSAAKSLRVAAFDCSDRVHFYLDGAPLALVGRGPGASTGLLTIPAKAKENTLVCLIDNMGRTSEGNAMGEPKGLFGPLTIAAPFKAGTPKLEQGTPIDPLSVRSPIFDLESAGHTNPRRVTWHFHHRKKTPLALVIESFPTLGVLILNDKPIAIIPAGTWERLILSHETLGKSATTLQIAVLGDPDAALASLKSAAFYELEQPIAAKTAWAFAKWETPTATKFKPLGKSGGLVASSLKGTPVWWKGLFGPASASPSDPLFLDVAHLSKGVAFLNGHHLGRYFSNTADGKPVPPQSRLYLPEPWLKHDHPNELVLFDEHGFSPESCRVTGLTSV